MYPCPEVGRVPIVRNRKIWDVATKPITTILTTLTIVPMITIATYYFYALYYSYLHYYYYFLGGPCLPSVG